MYIWEKINPPILPYSKETYSQLTKFGKYVYNAYYYNKYVGAILSGPFGIGKSTTALHLGREIAQAIYGVNDLQGMQMALQSTLFTMEEVIDATRNLGTAQDWRDLDPYKAPKVGAQLRTPFYIWDDAGMHGSKYKHFLDMAESYDLQSNFDTIRDVTSCMIMTVPEDDELLKFIRGYRGNYSVEIIDLDGAYERRLDFWKYGKDPRGHKKKYKKWTSAPFSIYIPQPYYGQYRIMKNVAKIENYERYQKKREESIIWKQWRNRKLEKIKTELNIKTIDEDDSDESFEELEA